MTHSGTTVQHRRAFTLIELLAVIAIIAILASILFPVFARARDNARRAACLSNSKQIGLGLQQYTQDYDERLPLYFYLTPSFRGWNEMLQPYLKSTQIFTCPSASKIKNCDPAVVTAALGSGSYGYNGQYLGSGPSIATIQKTAETIVITEITGIVHVNYSYPPTTWGYSRTVAQMSSCYGAAGKIGEGFSTRHFDGNNLVFADGHAKWMKKEAVGDSNRDGSNDDLLWDLD
jgi:prepilin-type N-terminal cleavage/methylation domain-containing protein/prepilin-type processing-associated H-X9-DG protein